MGLVGALFALNACAGRSAREATISTTPPVTWLCRPGMPGDACEGADRTSTELRTREVRPYVPAALPDVDCFYLYPTVDMELVPGNHEALDDRRNVLPVTLAQVGHFGATCALWVPLYRQVTLGTWLQPKDELEKGLARAYGDVERAFAEYLARVPAGRRVVLVGHSQGAEMVVRLLRRFFEYDAAMRARLVLALAIGGEVDVATGHATGGTFDTIPICSRPLETGCVVAYRTHAAGEAVAGGRFASPPGRETACVNPATLDVPDAEWGAPGSLSRAIFPVRGVFGVPLRGTASVRTPFVELDSRYTARCVDGTHGYRYLEVGAVDAEAPIDLHDRRFRTLRLGLHVLDMQLAQGDLVRLVERRVGRATTISRTP